MASNHEYLRLDYGSILAHIEVRGSLARGPGVGSKVVRLPGRLRVSRGVESGCPRGGTADGVYFAAGRAGSAHSRIRRWRGLRVVSGWCIGPQCQVSRATLFYLTVPRVEHTVRGTSRVQLMYLVSSSLSVSGTSVALTRDVR